MCCSEGCCEGTTWMARQVTETVMPGNTTCSICLVAVARASLYFKEGLPGHGRGAGASANHQNRQTSWPRRRV